MHMCAALGCHGHEYACEARVKCPLGGVMRPPFTPPPPPPSDCFSGDYGDFKLMPRQLHASEFNRTHREAGIRHGGFLVLGGGPKKNCIKKMAIYRH